MKIYIVLEECPRDISEIIYAGTDRDVVNDINNVIKINKEATGCTPFTYGTCVLYVWEDGKLLKTYINQNLSEVWVEVNGTEKKEVTEII